MRPRRLSLRQLLDDVFTRAATLATRMPEPAATDAILDIEDQVVARAGCDTHGHDVKSERVTGFPRDYVVCTRGIAADSEGSDDLSFFVIESETSTKNDYPTNRFPH